MTCSDIIHRANVNNSTWLNLKQLINEYNNYNTYFVNSFLVKKSVILSFQTFRTNNSPTHNFYFETVDLKQIR